MRNKLSVLLGALLGALAVFTSCGGEEESTAKNELNVFGQTFSLGEPTFYVYDEDEYDMVSDNSEASTHSYVGLEVFDNDTYADESPITYYGYIELYWPIDEEVGDDEFVVLGDDDEFEYEASSRTASFYIYYDFQEGSTFDSWISPYKWVGIESNSEDGTSISVKETSSGVRVSFSGPLEYWTYISGWIWVDEDLKEATISVEGALGTIPSNPTRSEKNSKKK
jgi:hypothetical protein